MGDFILRREQGYSLLYPEFFAFEFTDMHMICGRAGHFIFDFFFDAVVFFGQLCNMMLINGRTLADQR